RERVGPNGLQWMRLAERHVLERRGVEDDLRLVPGQEALERLRVAHRGQDAAGPVSERRAHRAFDVVERRLCGLEEEPVGYGCFSSARELARELASDAAARTGDEHALAGEEALQLDGGEIDALPGQEVLGGHRHGLSDGDAPAQDGLEGGNDAEVGDAGGEAGDAAGVARPG